MHFEKWNFVTLSLSLSFLLSASPSFTMLNENIAHFHGQPRWSLPTVWPDLRVIWTDCCRMYSCTTLCIPLMGFFSLSKWPTWNGKRIHTCTHHRLKKKERKRETAGHIRQSVDQESVSNASSRIIKNSSFLFKSILRRLYNGQIDFDRTSVDYLPSISFLNRNNRFLLWTLNSFYNLC